MEGAELKNKLNALGYPIKDIAEKLNMSPQQLNNTFNVADVKSGLLERISKVLNLPITYFYGIQPEIVNTALSGNGNTVAANNSTATSGANDDIVKQLLEEIKALRQQNERLTEKLLNP